MTGVDFLFVSVILCVVTCTCSGQEENETSVEVSPEQLWSLIRMTLSLDLLHHSDHCEPEIGRSLFKRLMNLPRDGVSFDIVEEITRGIVKTCDGRRYMTCDPTLNRCVCNVDAIWIPHNQPNPTNSSGSSGVNQGECQLRLNARCYGSEGDMLGDPKNPLRINPPYAPCVGQGNSTQCTQGKCTCINQQSKECDEVEHIFQNQIAQVMDDLERFEWAGVDESCEPYSPLIIDTRTDTLRDLRVRIKEWTNQSMSLSNICNFRLGLTCQHPPLISGANTTLTGNCKCGQGYTWYEGRCRGELGSLCQIRLWGESDSVGYQLDDPCMPELNCSEVRFFGIQRMVAMCCYEGIYKYRNHDGNDGHDFPCSKGTCADPIIITLFFFVLLNHLPEGK